MVEIVFPNPIPVDKGSERYKMVSFGQMVETSDSFLESHHNGK